MKKKNEIKNCCPHCGSYYFERILTLNGMGRIENGEWIGFNDTFKESELEFLDNEINCHGCGEIIDVDKLITEEEANEL